MQMMLYSHLYIYEYSSLNVLSASLCSAALYKCIIYLNLFCDPAALIGTVADPHSEEAGQDLLIGGG